MNRRAAMATAIALTATVSLAACGQEDVGPEAGAPQDGKPRVCLIMKSLANEFFQEMQKGAQDHAAQLGTLTLDAAGTQNETDVDGQVALVEKCITNRAQAMVLAPADSKALVQSVAKASRAGIKVVNIDVRLDEAALRQAGIEVPYVGPDNREGAKLSGLELAKVLGPNAKVVILEGNPGADNAVQRKNGFEDAVKEGGMQLLETRTAHWETDEAHRVFGNMLTARPDIQGVLSSNDAMSLGVIKVIQERRANIKVASFDNIPAIRQYLDSGVLVATLDQFGSQQAANGIDYALDLINGEQVTGWQKTPIKVVTKANAG